MTGQEAIQEVLFFPQMKPEKAVQKDTTDKFTALGIPEDWAPVVQKAGILKVKDLAGLNANKFHQDICGINKKNKMDLKNPSRKDVQSWISAAENLAWELIKQNIFPKNKPTDLHVIWLLKSFSGIQITDRIQ